MNTIQNKGATLDVLNLPSMTGIADPNLRQLMTNLIIELYKYQAESERKRIIERQQQGIALVMKLLNHSSEQMTLAYLGLDQETTKSMLDKIDFG